MVFPENLFESNSFFFFVFHHNFSIFTSYLPVTTALVWSLISVALINKHEMKFQTLWSYAGSVIILVNFVTQPTTIYFADPNRPGMHMKLIKWLLEVKAPRIVYVSCNPATCARDLDYLCHGVVCFVLLCSYLNSFWYFSSFVILSHCFNNLNAGRERFGRMLWTQECNSCGYVSPYSSYWVCVLIGAALIFRFW